MRVGRESRARRVPPFSVSLTLGVPRHMQKASESPRRSAEPRARVRARVSLAVRWQGCSARTMQLALRLQIEVHPDAAELRPRLGLRRPIDPTSVWYGARLMACARAHSKWRVRERLEGWAGPVERPVGLCGSNAQHDMTRVIRAQHKVVWSALPSERSCGFTAFDGGGMRARLRVAMQAAGEHLPPSEIRRGSMYCLHSLQRSTAGALIFGDDVVCWAGAGRARTPLPRAQCGESLCMCSRCASGRNGGLGPVPSDLRERPVAGEAVTCTLLAGLGSASARSSVQPTTTNCWGRWDQRGIPRCLGPLATCRAAFA